MVRLRSRVPLPLRRAVLAAAWLACVIAGAPAAVRHAPMVLQRAVSLPVFTGVLQATSVAIGLGLAWLLLDDPRGELGLRRPRALAVALSVLASPVLFFVTSYVALAIAEPTIMRELAEGMTHASRRNAAGVARVVTEAPWPVTLAAGALLAATSEELLFRGALWGGVRETAREILGGTWAGVLATALSAALFAWMHADVPGGVGIVRVVSSACLGLACGAARHAGKSLALPVVLHLANNLFAIARARGWLG